MIAIAMLLACSSAQARPHHRHHHRHHHVAHHASVHHAAQGRICTRTGNCARVVAWATAAFQGAIREFEALGYAIGSPGCLSGGHMRHSKHHWGGACDLFNQVARNRTALRQPPPRVQIAVAERHGLISGCRWRSPDCGHIETPTRLRYARAG
jgi:hypothetical protein